MDDEVDDSDIDAQRGSMTVSLFDYAFLMFGRRTDDVVCCELLATGGRSTRGLKAAG